MKLNSSILVVMDANAEYQASLVQALKIAKKTSVDVELFVVAYSSDFVNPLGFNQEQLENGKTEYLATKKRWVETYATEVKSLGIKVSVDVVWHSDISSAILEKVAGTNISLVIKTAKQDSLINKIFFTPSDWQLLEHCLVPVLLTKNAQSTPYQQIMSAINPSVNQGDSTLIDAEILQASLTMSRMFDAQAHVCHCYDAKDAQLWRNISQIGLCNSLDITDFQTSTNEAEIKTKSIFERLLIDFTFDENLIHIVEGSPLKKIPALVKSKSVDLLVMGMCNNGKYIGNTIEKVLDNVDCDLLSIRA